MRLTRRNVKAHVSRSKQNIKIQTISIVIKLNVTATLATEKRFALREILYNDYLTILKEI